MRRAASIRGGAAARALAAALVVALPASSAAGAALEKTSELGPVTACVRLEPEAPVIGDTVSLTITVSAAADVEVLMPEFGEALDRFLIVDFKPVPDRLADGGRTVREQRYTLSPRLSGKQSIPPILVEFVDRRAGNKPAPEGEDAYELLTERLDFEVASVLPKGETPDLRPALGALGPLPQPGAARWPWVAAAAAALAIASPFLWRAFRYWRRLARRRSAYDIAHAQLEKLLAATQGDGSDVDGFFVQLSGIIRRYIENRFVVHAPELTTEEFLAAAGDSADFSPAHQRLLQDFLRQADLVKFARLRPGRAEVDASVARARQFLEETREASPLIDIDSAATPAEGQAAGG